MSRLVVFWLLVASVCVYLVELSAGEGPMVVEVDLSNGDAPQADAPLTFFNLDTSNITSPQGNPESTQPTQPEAQPEVQQPPVNPSLWSVPPETQTPSYYNMNQQPPMYSQYQKKQPSNCKRETNNCCKPCPKKKPDPCCKPEPCCQPPKPKKRRTIAAAGVAVESPEKSCDSCC